MSCENSLKSRAADPSKATYHREESSGVGRLPGTVICIPPAGLVEEPKQLPIGAELPKSVGSCHLGLLAP